jgi:peptide/nickel transport system permease protein
MSHCLSPLLVQRISVFAYAISTEVSLSCLGVGAPPELPSWGHILSEGLAYEGSAPCIAMVPGLVIMATVLGLTFMRDGLRDELDPRLRGI